MGKRLVVSESAIDALSHAVLFPDNRARYASIGGKPNPQQLELIRMAIARMPVDSEIVSAMDADADGEKLTEIVRRAVELTGRIDLRFTVNEPMKDTPAATRVADRLAWVNRASIVSRAQPPRTHRYALV